MQSAVVSARVLEQVYEGSTKKRRELRHTEVHLLDFRYSIQKLSYIWHLKSFQNTCLKRQVLSQWDYCNWWNNSSFFPNVHCNEALRLCGSHFIERNFERIWENALDVLRIEMSICLRRSFAFCWNSLKPADAKKLRFQLQIYIHVQCCKDFQTWKRLSVTVIFRKVFIFSAFRDLETLFKTFTCKFYRHQCNYNRSGKTWKLKTYLTIYCSSKTILFFQKDSFFLKSRKRQRQWKSVVIRILAVIVEYVYPCRFVENNDHTVWRADVIWQIWNTCNIWNQSPEKIVLHSSFSKNEWKRTKPLKKLKNAQYRKIGLSTSHCFWELNEIFCYLYVKVWRTWFTVSLMIKF